MNRAKAYVNRLVKIKEQEIEDTYHQNHLKEMKPRSKKLMEHSETILINHGKREMIKQVREIQIERENKLLLQKIAGVMGKKGAYSVAKTKNIRTKVNKSLNEIYRKRQLQNIQLENKRFLQRLQTKRPTLNIQKINREWIQNKSILKRMANADFYLTNIQSSSRMRSITGQKFNKSKYEKMRLVKAKVVDGHKMLIKIEFLGEFLKIVADAQDKRDIKIIEIPKDEAIILIQKDCQGKFQLLFQKLKYDDQSQTLYIVSENLQDQEMNLSEFNPEIDRIFRKTQSNTKRVIGQEKLDKLAASKGMINHSIKQKSNQTEKEKTINNKVQEKQIPQEKIEKSNNEIKAQPPVQESTVQRNKSVQKDQKPANNQDYREIQFKQIQTKKEPELKKQDRIVEKELVKVTPQEEQKYEEQKFEQLHQKQEVKKEIQQKQIAKQPHKNQKEIIIEPESTQNYNEQFQVSGQAAPQKIAQHQKKIKA